MNSPPNIAVGIMDRRFEISGYLNGYFSGVNFGPLSGRFSAKAASGRVVLFDANGHEISRSPLIKLTSTKGSLFSLYQVTIGNRFHWERTEDQTFKGNLILRHREDGTICAINEIPIEDYLTSVISSEMSGEAPTEFLKAHAILSRSWLLAALTRKKNSKEMNPSTKRTTEDEVIRWYGRTDHDLFDVCADDHCQRYQGIMKIVSGQAEEAVRQTQGNVVIFQDEICDARYSKACGGITENFETAWDDRHVPYLTSMSDAPLPHQSIHTEKEAKAWIFSEPSAYCNTRDKRLLEIILPGVDRETENYFRWRVEYSRTEMEDILRDKSGVDFGTLKEIIPLQRGPSGRISRLKILGAQKTLVIVKELEIRRWLSRTHLYSSAFVVTADADRFILYGAGWGHGVGLCQIGAAVMASKGFSAEEILKHYFPGTDLKKIY
jgi:SpoIID/LytB domain protein